MARPIKKVAKLKPPPKPKRQSGSNKAAQAIIKEHLTRTQGMPAANQMIVDPVTVIREHVEKIGAKGVKKATGARRSKK